jgi:hypothetical protein
MLKIICKLLVILAFIINVQKLNAKNDEEKITAFEKKVAAKFSTDEKVVKLIGCRIFEIKPEHRAEFKATVEANPTMLAETEEQTYFAEDYSYFRLYFALHTAIIDCNGVEYTADEKGLVSLPDSCDISKIKVIGRKKSETVQGSPVRDTLPDRVLLELTQGVTDGIKTGYSHKKEKISVFIFTKEWSM